MAPSAHPKVSITGATGAIGLEILHQLQAKNQLQGVSVLVRDTAKNRKTLKPFGTALTVYFGDITQPETLVAPCKYQDVVLHLAAVIPPLAETNPELGRRVNIEGTRSLINTLERESPNAQLIFSSSIVVYGDRLKTPYISVHDPLQTEHNDAYGTAKIACEAMLQTSKLNWTILRLTAIMGYGNHKISGIMFRVPLATPMEIATVKDTARAFVNSLQHLPELNKRIFNLSGGDACRITYKEFMQRSFKCYGMGAVNFPEHSFAEQNFHCGYYKDASELNAILDFQNDTLQHYFENLNASIPAIQRILTRPFAGIIKWYLSTLSEPLKAYKTKNQQEMNFFFGTDRL